MTKDLLGELNAANRGSVHYRRGEVTATAPLTIEIGDSGAPYTSVKRLASYTTPAVGHQVAVLIFGNDLLVLGQIA